MRDYSGLSVICMSPVDFLVQLKYHIKLELYCSQLVWMKDVVWFGTITSESQGGKYCLMPGAQCSGALLDEPATPLPAPPCLLRPHHPIPIRSVCFYFRPYRNWGPQ